MDDNYFYINISFDFHKNPMEEIIVILQYRLKAPRILEVTLGSNTSSSLSKFILPVHHTIRLLLLLLKEKPRSYSALSLTPSLKCSVIIH